MEQGMWLRAKVRVSLTSTDLGVQLSQTGLYCCH